MPIYYTTNNWWQNGQNGVIFLSTATMKPGDEDPTGQFYLWSPLMIFSLIMAIVVGVIILALLLYGLFYCCMYGTCCCMPGGAGCFWCPQQQAGPPVDEPVKVRIRRPSRSESCRSSVRSTCSHQSEGGRMVRINSCPSISESCGGGPQPIIIQTIPALPAPQPSTIQPVMAPAPPAPSCGCHTGGCGGGCRGGNSSNFGGGELRVVIGEGKPAASSNRSGGNVLVYDMGRSNGGGVSLGGGGLSLGGGGRSEYVLTSVDDNHYGGSYRKSGAFNEGFDRDEGGSCFSDGHRSAVIDIGKGGNFYPSLPQYDD